MAAQSACWGGISVAETMGSCVGSTRKKARILRWPGLARSASSNGETQCWKRFGQASARPAFVTYPAVDQILSRNVENRRTYYRTDVLD
jgi:hypothetical protein